MSSPPDRSAIRNADANLSIIDSARANISERGLAGMSLRFVSDHAGISVGSISYRIGDRAALVEAVLEREIDLLAVQRRAWRDRFDGFDPVASDILPDLIGDWLDLAAGERRISAIVLCELALMASRNPQTLPAFGRVIEEGEAMWRDLLAGSSDGARLATLIAHYCLDEQPFSILLSGNADYRLLRQSTIRALLRTDGTPINPQWGRWHMTLIERLAIPAAAALDTAGQLPHGAKATIADHIADVIIAQGVGAVSHRAVAQLSAMPASSIAHHFPTHRDILFAGVEAIYRRMRAGIRSADVPTLDGGDIIRLTHESALIALGDPALLPFAIDMRRRRAENVHAQVAEWLGIPIDSDRSRVQAIVMAVIGHGLRSLSTGQGAGDAPDFIRTSTMTVRSF